jgi:purine-binding chemotaxis protein CheW
LREEGGAAETSLGMSQCVVFAIDERLYGIRLSTVSRVVHAVEITPLPKAPPIVIGVINLSGLIVPVVSLRRRFRLCERDLALTDQIIVAHAARPDAEKSRILALVVDQVVGVRDLPAEETIGAETILPGLEHLEGVAKTERGLILIHDLGTFLSLEEERILDATPPEARK